MEKVCVNHPESPSVGSCKACEKPVCLMCITEVQGVSFCSDACGAAYQEVKDWLERPAAEEEWNPLADAKPKGPAAKAPAPAPAPAPEPEPEPAAFEVEPAPAPSDAASPNLPAVKLEDAPNRMPLYIAIAATVLVLIGGYILFGGGEEKPPVEPTPIAKVEPPKPPPPPPPPPPPKPEPVKVEPPKPPPPPPPKPEPVKVDPPKPPLPPVPVLTPKPEPAKVEPPKPEPAKVEPPKPPPPPPKPEPAKVEPPKPEPPPAPHLAFVRDPWGKEKTGTWYRIKATAGGKDSYKDVGLRETGAGYRVLVSQSSAEGKTEPEQFTWTEPEEVAVFGSVNGDVKGTKYAADVVRTKASKPSQFVFKDGPHAGAVFSSDVTLAGLATETVKVKDREFACSVMEAEPKDGKKGAKTWFSTQVPLGIVKWEADGASSAIVDYGTDWEKRPPFPAPPVVIAKVDPPPPPPPPVVVPPPPPPPPVVVPPPPPPPPVKPEPAKVEPAKVDPAKEEATARAKKSISDANALIKEASPMYGEVSAAMDALPGDKASLRDLYRKAERVNLKLSDAKILYSSVRGDAPDPALIDRRVSQLDELLDAVRDCMKQLKSRLD